MMRWKNSKLLLQLLFDRTLHPYNYAETELIFSNNLLHEQHGLADRTYDDSMVTNAILPLADADVDIALWLEDCFLYYGDSAPNRNIKQLSATFKNDIYNVYYHWRNDKVN